jgi:hypothetical protein
MNASIKVITPEQHWHNGREAEAFWGLLDKHDKLMQEHLKLQEEIKELKKLNKSLAAAAAPKPPIP